MILRSIVER